MSTAVWLKEGTRDLHLAAEKALHAEEIRGGTLSLPVYENLLHRHYAVWSAAANQLDVRKLSGASEFTQIMREALRRDLDMLEQPVAAPANLLLPSGEAEAWGLLYVLRGSTLGGTMINRMLSNSPELKDLPHYHFYGAFETLPARHWPDFLRQLEVAVPDDESRSRALVGAKAVFQAYLGQVSD